MRFAKTTEYTIRVMVYLSNNRENLYSVYRLHNLLNIPYKYLGRLMSKLAANGFVVATQGKQGGFRINEKRSPIYLGEIIDTVEGLDDYKRCVLGFSDCSENKPCSLHKYWGEQIDNLNKMITTTRLDDLR
jgi:Rrf2 family protein